MKNTLKFAVVLFAGIMLFAGCSDGDSDPIPSDSGMINGNILKFNLSGVSTIASVETSNGNGMRAAESTEEPLVAIEKNGETKSIILSDYNAASLPPIAQLIKKTAADDKEYLYIVFVENCYLAGENLGQIICVSEDGSCAKVIEDNYHLSGSYSYGGTAGNAVQFDGDGNAYYCASSYNGTSSATVIFKYNPCTKTKTRLTAAVENRSYSQIQIDSRGEWIFVTGSQYSSSNSQEFFRAIPVSDPGNFKNLGNYGNYYNWICYEDAIYFQNGNSVQKLSKKDGTYSDNSETIFGTAPTQENGNIHYIYGAYDMLSQQQKQQYSLKEFCTVYGQYGGKEFYLTDENGNTNLAEIKNAFLYMLYDYDNTNSSDSYEENLKALAETYDFRFDKFADITGLESLAEISKGKKNEEAFEAILSSESHAELLARLLSQNYSSISEPTARYVCDSSINYSYRYNFLADITYLKGTDTLLDNTGMAESIFSKTGAGKYYANNGTINIFYSTYADSAEWQDNYKNDDGSVNAAQVLQGFFSLCNIEGDKEFRLGVFKDDEEYGALYSKATDEEAVKFISETPKKLGLFYQFISDYSESWLEKVAEICFIKGTDISAYEEQTASQEIGIHRFMIMNGGCLYGIGGNYKPGEFVLVKLINANGELVNDVKTFNVQCESYNAKFSGNKFYFMENDDKGNAKLYALNIDSGEVIDLLRKFPEAGNSNFMLISFEAAGNNVYFSAESGLDILNRVIDTETNTITKISSNSKFTNILSLN